MKTLVAEVQGQPQTGGKKMGKAKRKRVTVSEQYSNLQAMCRSVKAQLKQRGIDIPDSHIEVIGNGLPDGKTNALVVNALAPVAFLLTRFSGLAHWFQRK